MGVNLNRRYLFFLPLVVYLSNQVNKYMDVEYQVEIVILVYETQVWRKQVF